MSEVSCTACQELREDAPDFVINGVTEAVCESLHDDTGLDADNGNNDETDLHTANDCLIGRMEQEINYYDICDWKKFMKQYITSDYEVNKAIICALGGLWSAVHELIEALGGGGGYIPVIRKYTYTVPVTKFIQTWTTPCTTEHGDSSTLTAWFSGSPQQDEDFITIPVTEMESVLGVWAQPKVVGYKTFAATVAVQSYAQEGSNLIVNFDAYEIANTTSPSFEPTVGPYALPVEFLVVGKKKI